MSYNAAFGLAFLMLVAGSFSPGPALADSKCYECHAEPRGSEAEARDQAKESPLIDRSHLEESVHKALDCLACHADIQSLPHAEELEPVDCSECHEVVGWQYLKGVHGAAFAKGNATVSTTFSQPTIRFRRYIRLI